MLSESEAFPFAVVHMDGHTTVALGGELDLAAAPDLSARLESLIEASEGGITVDFTEVTFLDSTGLVAILTAQRRFGESGRRLKVRNPSTSVRRVLELSGASDVLDVEAPALDAAAD